MKTLFALFALTSAATTVTATGCLAMELDYSERHVAADQYAATSEQGHTLQGHTLQGHTLQGTQTGAAAISHMSLDNIVSETVATVSLNGTTLTGVGHDSSVMGPNDMIGLVFDIALSNGTSGTLTLTDYVQDTSVNTLYELANQSNHDVHLYTAMISHPGAAAPYNVCGDDGQGFVIAGAWDATGSWSDGGSTFEVSFVCTTGVIAKCIRGWGYKPWQAMTSQGQQYSAAAMRDFHSACTRAARIDMIDTAHFNRPHSETAGHGMFSYESTFVNDGICDIVRTRYDHLDPTTGQGCIKPEDISEPNSEWKSDSAWSDPTLAQASLEYRWVAVATSTACTHSPSEPGEPLAADCNQCTTIVCDAVTGDASCCTNEWTGSCVEAAEAACSAATFAATPMPKEL